MKDEVLLEMYKVQVVRSEHYENQRAVVTNLVIALSAALVALTTFDGTLYQVDVWNGLLIVLLGIVSLVASKLHGARSRRHGKRAAEYRNALDQMLPNADINAVHECVGREKIYLYRVWNGLHAAVVVIGVLISVLAVLG
jgi:hypothetical protein